MSDIVEAIVVVKKEDTNDMLLRIALVLDDVMEGVWIEFVVITDETVEDVMRFVVWTICWIFCDIGILVVNAGWIENKFLIDSVPEEDEEDFLEPWHSIQNIIMVI